MEKVIIVAKSNFVSSVLKMYISNNSYRVVDCVKSFSEAIESCRIHNPDIIFIDIEFKESNRLNKVIQDLRSKHKSALVYVSFGKNKDIIYTSIDDSFCGYIEMPFDSTLLNQTIDYAIKRNRAYKEYISRISKGSEKDAVVLTKDNKIEYAKNVDEGFLDNLGIESESELTGKSIETLLTSDSIAEIFNALDSENYLKKKKPDKYSIETVKGHEYEVDIFSSIVVFKNKPSINLLFGELSSKE